MRRDDEGGGRCWSSSSISQSSDGPAVMIPSLSHMSQAPKPGLVTRRVPVVWLPAHSLCPSLCPSTLRTYKYVLASSALNRKAQTGQTGGGGWATAPGQGRAMTPSPGSLPPLLPSPPPSCPVYHISWADCGLTVTSPTTAAPPPTPVFCPPSFMVSLTTHPFHYACL